MVGASRCMVCCWWLSLPFARQVSPMAQSLGCDTRQMSGNVHAREHFRSVQHVLPDCLHRSLCCCMSTNHGQRTSHPHVRWPWPCMHVRHALCGDILNMHPDAPACCISHMYVAYPIATSFTVVSTVGGHAVLHACSVPQYIMCSAMGRMHSDGHCMHAPHPPTHAGTSQGLSRPAALRTF